RSRSAVRDMARALGFAPGQQEAWSKQVEMHGSLSNPENTQHEIPDQVVDLARQVLDAPRHLGIHSGGMVICDRPVSEVCPIEWGRMKDRSVLQWDKDDCAAIGLVKFDLLGLGMLSALHNAVDLIAEFRGKQIDLATIPQQDEVYAMLCRADTVGIFQIESRAQMATLPRLKPRRFYDLVVEVALIRPGPIQGGSVHPYIRRRNGQEPVTYLHPLLENSLGKTLGVPLFQEQLMQMAIDLAGFTANQADELRQAMGSKRSQLRMQRLRQRLYDGMARNQIVGAVADEIFEKMRAFANYGFPESHSVSFAYLVYASSWIKYHEPAAFYAALLNSQPMGFWSPHSLVQDARRHGVVVLGPDLNSSKASATLQPCTESTGGLAVRIGISGVRGIGDDLAKAIEAARPFSSMEDLVRRVPQLSLAQIEILATAGAYSQCFEVSRRDALWSAGAVIQSRPDRLAGVTTGGDSPQLPGMQPIEESICDLWSTGISIDGHPTQFVRAQLSELGVVTAADLPTIENSSRGFVGGLITHRQRPSTSKGVTFFNLEDETGLINIVVSRGCFRRFRHAAINASALVVSGKVESSQGVINIIAEHLSELKIDSRGVGSRNFR
ncbi:MAG: OB-fold nucleic acid binding domain-containing protein, partial [Actinomycetota bacterium]